MPLAMIDAAVAGRTYLPFDLDTSAWQAIEPLCMELRDRPLSDAAQLWQWLRDVSELEAAMSEAMGRRYIAMNCDTGDAAASTAFNHFVTEVEPRLAPYYDAFNRKLVSSPYVATLTGPDHAVMLRSVRKQIDLFRAENIPLFTRLQQDQQQYGTITGALTIEHEGKSITLQQAALLLKDKDRSVREQAYRKVAASRMSVAKELDALLDGLIRSRQQVAANCGYADFRDYSFVSMGRFDYTVQDCFTFHESIRTECVPLQRNIDLERKERLGLDTLRPWDTDVDVSGRASVRPFTDEKDLTERSIRLFTAIRPRYGEWMATMQRMGHLDLGSRIGKAPGGFQYPLYETGVPFIFMNAVGTVRDLITMIHEGGHAVHSFLSRDLELTAYKSLTSEVAELASMSMELFSFDHWHHFYADEADARVAKREHLTKIISILTWVAVVDRFQHWIYTHKGHTAAERNAAWMQILGEFGTGVVDHSGFENERAYQWQRQLHIYEVPFYYIEYAMAQLGAIALWRDYRNDPEATLDRYEAALALGYTRPIGEIYRTAGIRFDFSRGYVKELMAFVLNEYDRLS